MHNGGTRASNATQHVSHQARKLDKASMHDVREKWEGILGAVGFTMQATVHTTTWATPIQLVFGHDAIHNVKFQADCWQYIKERKQWLINQNNECENAKRTPHDYKVRSQ
jgi:hypothetical protein